MLIVHIRSLLTLGFLVFSLASSVLAEQTFGNLNEFAGRYSDGKDFAVYFELTAYGLTIRPVLWTATQLLRATGRDNFEVVDRTSRGADFLRDQTGKVVSVKITGMDGEGMQLIKTASPRLPIELVLSGQVRAAAIQYRQRGAAGLEAALTTAENIYQRLPTNRPLVVTFLYQLRKDFVRDPKYFSLLGFDQVSIGDRQSAKASFLSALKIDPTNADAISGLARLNALPTDFKSDKEPWHLPFPLSDVFRRPTNAEIRAVANDWQERDLAPIGIREEKRDEITIDGWTANVKIISYLIHGSRNYGAVIIPKNARAGCCPVILDIKGVSPTYFPLDLEKIESIRTLDDLKDRFIYVVPSFRGEVLNFHGIIY